MNYSVLRYTIGKILRIVSLLMILPLIIAFIYQEPLRNKIAFALTVVITYIFGWLLSLRRPEDNHYFAREGLAIVCISWFLLSFFGGLPFFISGEIPNLLDSFFEAVSGFTTTGASIIPNIESISHSLLFWRSFTHLIGGMGVLVFTLAVLPKASHDTVNIMKAEVPGPSFEKLLSKVRDTARILYAIYISMTAILIIILIICGMPVFDAAIHAFGAAGTGGFGIKSNSVAYYNSPIIEYVLGIAMLLFACNFNLYYLLLIKEFKQVAKNEEIRWFFGIFAGAVILIFINLAPNYDGNYLNLFRDVFFTVASIQTTTGYSTVNFGDWPTFSHVILLGVMFVGGCAGSTAGGIKASRIAIYIKQAFGHLKQTISPNRTIVLKQERRPLNQDALISSGNYLALYTFSFIIFLIIASINAPDFCLLLVQLRPL